MKKKTALYILAAAICIILAAFIFNIPTIKSACIATFGIMKSPYVIGAAAACAFIFISSKNYWLIITACAVVTSLIIQYGIIGSGAGLYTILYRALAFITIVYLLNLVKAILNK